MKSNGTVWVVTKFKNFGEKVIPEKTFVILTEQGIYDWMMKTAEDSTRQNYHVDEVKCYN